MSIPFVCEHCGHPIDVDDRLAGMHGRCKHCGQPLVVPGPGHAHGKGQDRETGDDTAGLSLRLRPMEAEEPPRVADHLLARPVPLAVRPTEDEPRIRPAAISDPDSDPAPTGTRRGGGPHAAGAGGDYTVLDPHHVSETHSSTGPPPLWTLLPTLTARFVARQFRSLRDRLYVVSIFFLVLVLIGYLFQLKILLHLGAVGVIAANIGMLGAGLAYLVTLPFKEGLRYGLANLLIPFYAIYYWTTRWSRMKTAVSRTLGSFLPILLVAIAYIVYREGPAVEQALEKEIPALEKALDDKVPALDRKVDELLLPQQKNAGPVAEPVPEPERVESPRRRARGRSPAQRVPPY
jgi:hypothetical protein